MATLRIAVKQLSPSTSFFLDADIIQTDTANRRWRVRYYLRANNGPGGSTASQFGGTGVQAGRGNNVEFGRHSGNPFLPGGYPDNTQRWSDMFDVWINANSNGYWSGTSTTYPLTMHLTYGNVSWSGDGNITLPRIGGVPAKPSVLNIKQILAQSVVYQIGAPSNSGSPITTYNHQVARNASFNSGLIAWNSGSLTQTVSGLRPNTPYWVRYRAVNAFGNGPWSDAKTFTTLATEAPGRSVTPSPDGTSARVNASPPSGMGGVSSYRIEYRVTDAVASTIVNTITPSTVVSPLVPGLTYQWRVSAFIDDYQTPWSTWVTVTQPKPNVNPGDYFDGSSAAKPDNTFAWAGTANNSLSRMLAPTVRGWGIDPGDSGATAVLHRVTGGQSQQFAARVTVTGSASAPGIRAGIARGNLMAADVSEGGTYRARIAVRPSRAQRGVGEVAWWTSSDVLIERAIFTDEMVVPEGSWTLLTGTAEAPPASAYATVAFLDVAGTGHSPWLSGETYDLDSAFLTLGADLIDYFDGATPDTSMFDHAWTGLANRSPSLRRTIDQDPPNPLADPDCDPIPGAPLPPVIANACIDETGSWRRYWAIISETEVYSWLAVVPTITISTATTPARQVRLRFYENPDSLAPADADGLPFQSEQIVSFLPKDTTITIDAVSETAWAVIAGGSEIPAEELLYGTNGGPATWPEFTCGMSYLVSFDVPLDAPIGNLTYGVSLTTMMS